MGWGYNGSGVRVAVADSGIDFAHPDLMEHKPYWTIQIHHTMVGGL